MAIVDPWKNLSRLTEVFSYAHDEELPDIPAVGARRDDKPEMLLVGVTVSHEDWIDVTLEWVKAPR